MSLLFAVKQSPGIGVRGLAARERMSPAGMSGHVRRLVSLGLLRREPDPADARRHGLYVTDEGKRILLPSDVVAAAAMGPLGYGAWNALNLLLGVLAGMTAGALTDWRMS